MIREGQDSAVWDGGLERREGPGSGQRSEGGRGKTAERCLITGPRRGLSGRVKHLIFITVW